MAKIGNEKTVKRRTPQFGVDYHGWAFRQRNGEWFTTGCHPVLFQKERPARRPCLARLGQWVRVKLEGVR